MSKETIGYGMRWLMLNPLWLNEQVLCSFSGKQHGKYIIKPASKDREQEQQIGSSQMLGGTNATLMRLSLTNILEFALACVLEMKWVHLYWPKLNGLTQSVRFT
jgi:hypothetical protein